MEAAALNTEMEETTIPVAPIPASDITAPLPATIPDPPDTMDTMEDTVADTTPTTPAVDTVQTIRAADTAQMDTTAITADTRTDSAVRRASKCT